MTKARFRFAIRSAARRSQRGVVAVMFLVTLVVSLGSLLAALDLARFQMAQARLQASLDAAVDAVLQRWGADTSRTAGEWQTALNPWLLAGYPASGFLQSTLVAPVPGVQISADALVAEAQGELRLVSAGLLNLATADFKARRVVPLTEADVDVVIAIDVATLQSSSPDLMRDAAAGLITGLMQQPGTRVALVPFSDTINLNLLDPSGSWLAAAWRNAPWFDDIWRQCASELGVGQATPGALIAWPGSQGSLAPMAVRSVGNFTLPIQGGTGENNLFLRPNTAQIQAGSTPVLLNASNSAASIGNNQATVQLELLLPVPAYCNNANALTAMSTNPAGLLDRVNQLTLDSQASLLPTGLLWAWRVMNTAPPTASSQNRRRAIVILSDGNNSPAAAAVQPTTSLNGLSIQLSIQTQWCPNPNNCSFPPPGNRPATVTINETIDVNATATRRAVTSLNTDGTTIATGRSQISVGDLDDYTTAICNNIQSLAGNDAIELHTLTVGTPNNPTLLPQCVGAATPERHRLINSGNWATAVDDLVAELTAPLP